MQTIRLSAHVGSDGLLKLEVPLEIADADLEVTVVIQPIAEMVGAADEWPAGYFATVVGALSDDPLTRPEQGEYEQREPFAWSIGSIRTRSFVSSIAVLPPSPRGWQLPHDLLSAPVLSSRLSFSSGHIGAKTPPVPWRSNGPFWHRWPRSHSTMTPPITMLNSKPHYSHEVHLSALTTCSLPPSRRQIA